MEKPKSSARGDKHAGPSGVVDIGTVRLFIGVLRLVFNSVILDCGGGHLVTAPDGHLTPPPL